MTRAESLLEGVMGPERETMGQLILEPVKTIMKFELQFANKYKIFQLNLFRLHKLIRFTKSSQERWKPATETY